MSGFICLVFILFVIVGKSLLKGGDHSKGRLLKNINCSGSVHSMGVHSRVGALSRKYGICILSDWFLR